ncbi:hypothetical protein [Euzebya tangerina]|uniref:hypothetical protein n=1 Tax=Euzebya tangerina TaxID=591198 RepID=UPI00196A2440|nr:hypothetical protein [Euzebya tangerina]
MPAEHERLRRAEGIGISEAVNRLIRAGLAAPPAARPYLHRTAAVGITVDVANVGEVLDLLDQA